MMADRAEANRVLGSEARDLEGDLGDLLDMSGLTVSYIESILEDRASDGRTYPLGDEHVSQVLFAVHHTHRMINDFRKRYYAAIEAKG